MNRHTPGRTERFDPGLDVAELHFDFLHEGLGQSFLDIAPPWSRTSAANQSQARLTPFAIARSAPVEPNQVADTGASGWGKIGLPSM